MKELGNDEQDINDIFDNIALCENTLSSEGFDEGLEVGSAEGERDGYHLGYHRGAEIGSQIGYFKGFLYILEKNLTKGLKVQQYVDKFKALLNDFPKDNCEEVDLMSSLETLKGLYKIICSQMKITPSLTLSEELSF